MTEQDWQTLVWGLANGDCILLLGDEATGSQGRTVRDDLMADLKSTLKAPPQPELDLPQIAWLYQSEKSRTDLVRRVASFYEAQAGHVFDVHARLATLPFHCIITSAHDGSMRRALESPARMPNAAAYQFKGVQEPLGDAGTPARPLVYHLFGRAETPRSLVLTEYDLVDFLVAVVAKTPPIPEVLLAELRNPDRMFLLLGFGVRNWYPRVLLHVLKMQSGNSRSFALEEFPPPADLGRGVFFYRHGYKVEVFDEDVAGFVETLCDKFKGLSPPGVRGAAAAPVSGPRPTAFLCHVHENAAMARDLASGLEAQGLDPWLDQRNLEPGASWDDEIVRRIEQVDYFIVLITNELAARQKSYAFKELAIALEQRQMYRATRRFIIPLLVGDARMLPELHALHQGPVRGDGNEDALVLTAATRDEVVQRLASSIRRDQQLRLKKGA